MSSNTTTMDYQVPTNTTLNNSQRSFFSPLKDEAQVLYDRQGANHAQGYINAVSQSVVPEQSKLGKFAYGALTALPGLSLLNVGAKRNNIDQAVRDIVQHTSGSQTISGADLFNIYRANKLNTVSRTVTNNILQEAGYQIEGKVQDGAQDAFHLGPLTVYKGNSTTDFLKKNFLTMGDEAKAGLGLIVGYNVAQHLGWTSAAMYGSSSLASGTHEAGIELDSVNGLSSGVTGTLGLLGLYGAVTAGDLAAIVQSGSIATSGIANTARSTGAGKNSKTLERIATVAGVSSLAFILGGCGVFGENEEPTPTPDQTVNAVSNLQPVVPEDHSQANEINPPKIFTRDTNLIGTYRAIDSQGTFDGHITQEELDLAISNGINSNSVQLGEYSLTTMPIRDSTIHGRYLSVDSQDNSIDGTVTDENLSTAQQYRIGTRNVQANDYFIAQLTVDPSHESAYRNLDAFSPSEEKNHIFDESDRVVAERLGVRYHQGSADLSTIPIGTVYGVGNPVQSGTDLANLLHTMDTNNNSLVSQEEMNAYKATQNNPTVNDVSPGKFFLYNEGQNFQSVSISDFGKLNLIDGSSFKYGSIDGKIDALERSWADNLYLTIGGKPFQETNYYVPELLQLAEQVGIGHSVNVNIQEAQSGAPLSGAHTHSGSDPSGTHTHNTTNPTGQHSNTSPATQPSTTQSSVDYSKALNFTTVENLDTQLSFNLNPDYVSTLTSSAPDGKQFGVYVTADFDNDGIWEGRFIGGDQIDDGKVKINLDDITNMSSPHQIGDQFSFNDVNDRWQIRLGHMDTTKYNLSGFDTLSSYTSELYNDHNRGNEIIIPTIATSVAHTTPSVHTPLIVNVAPSAPVVIDPIAQPYVEPTLATAVDCPLCPTYTAQDFLNQNFSTLDQVLPVIQLMDSSSSNPFTSVATHTIDGNQILAMNHYGKVDVTVSSPHFQNDLQLNPIPNPGDGRIGFHDRPIDPIVFDYGENRSNLQELETIDLTQDQFSHLFNWLEFKEFRNEYFESLYQADNNRGTVSISDGLIYSLADFDLIESETREDGLHKEDRNWRGHLREALDRAGIKDGNDFAPKTRQLGRDIIFN